VLILCSVGFLIYRILSIKSAHYSRNIQGVGMYMREIITMLITEQLFISGLSIALGIAIGFLAPACIFRLCR
jgi:predicted lysophospholipase L1 biosynthesis ABC-type transport system permease subunit